MIINENTLEQAIISDLKDKGYEYLYGPEIERDYNEVILEYYFRLSMSKINDGISSEIITEAYRAIKNLGLLKLEDLNEAFHKYLLEGIPVPYITDGENRTYTVKLIDFENADNNDFKVINQFTIDDGATVPIYYENRTAKLKLNEDILKQIDEAYARLSGETSEREIEKSKADLSNLEVILGSKERLNLLAEDIIAHYEERQDILTGKAMIVCMSRKIAINLYKMIIEKRPLWDKKVQVVLTSNNQDPEEWHNIIKNKAHREYLMSEFKKEDSEFKIAIVVDMWLTGFDVPSMATMYIDKPMKGHNLMQAIARVNRVYKDKEAGLVVDYVGMAAALKFALSQYTKRDQDKVPDIGAAYSIAMAKLEIMRDYLYGFDYSGYLSDEDRVFLATINSGVDYALGFEEEEKKSFIKEATALVQAESLCRSLLTEREKKEIEYFRCVRAGLCKLGGGPVLTSDINKQISKLLEQAIEQDGVVNIYEQIGEKNPEISLLSEEYMEKIRKMKHKNLAAELLRKLLEDNINVFARTGVVKSKLFSEKLRNVMKLYNNRMITSAEVIDMLLELSVEMTDSANAGKDKGLTREELAFYEALVADPEVLKNMEDSVLVEMAHELTDLINKSRTVDWDKKESARAYMRTQVKHLLRKYKYPPEQAKNAIETVIKQAELMSSNIVI